MGGARGFGARRGVSDGRVGLPTSASLPSSLPRPCRPCRRRSDRRRSVRRRRRSDSATRPRSPAGKTRAASPRLPSNALFRSARVGINTSPAANAASASKASASTPPPRVDTTASSGARGETRIAPSSNSPAASPSANADGERCGANATRASTPPKLGTLQTLGTLFGTLLARGDDGFVQSGRRGVVGVAARRHASASKTSTPVGTAPSSRSGRMVSERTTTGKAPRTACEAYHAAARRTGWTSAATAAEDDGSASKGSDRRISRRRAGLTTEVARQWSLGKSLTRPRRSPHSARIARRRARVAEGVRRLGLGREEHDVARARALEEIEVRHQRVRVGHDFGTRPREAAGAHRAGGRTTRTTPSRNTRRRGGTRPPRS